MMLGKAERCSRHRRVGGWWAIGALGLLIIFTAGGQSQTGSTQGDHPHEAADPGYVLGPDDLITVRAVDSEEISDKPVRIDTSGYIRLPVVGRLHAAGLTLDQLEVEIKTRLKAFIIEPDVVVSITEFRSQPVSVIGRVRAPGVHQIQGRKTLIEVLSLAGGLSDDAGSTVKITRTLESGRIPLRTAKDDPTGKFSVAEVNLQSLLNAANPEENVLVRPHDVISVPRADMVYVAGEVVRSGGYVLNDRETLSVLKALALAGGLNRGASAKNARILRTSPGGAGRVEIAVDLSKLVAGRGEDLALKPDDILFVPSSAPKKAALRAVEAAIQVGTGVAIWRR